MKYTIEAIENAKPGMRWEEIGCQWTLGQAYLYSKEAGNDLPNFAEVIWDYDIEAILEDCRKLGVKEFTISSTHFGSDEHALIPAFKMTVKEA